MGFPTSWCVALNQPVTPSRRGEPYNVHTLFVDQLDWYSQPVLVVHCTGFDFAACISSQYSQVGGWREHLLAVQPGGWWEHLLAVHPGGWWEHLLAVQPGGWREHLLKMQPES